MMRPIRNDMASVVMLPDKRTRVKVSMKRIVGLLFFSFAALVCGCGSGSSGTTSSTAPPPTPPTQSFTPALNGNWALHLTSGSGAVNDGGGNFTTAGSKVSGTVFLEPSSCFVTLVNGFGQLDSIAVAGTVTSSGALTLTSSPVQGVEVLTIKGTVSSSGLNAATYSVAGGCDAGDGGTVSGWAAPPLDGTYTGNFISKSGITNGVSVTITQSSQPGSNGMYSASGSATFASSCFSTGTFSPTDAGDPAQLVFGDFVQVEIETNGGASVIFQGTVDSTGRTITGTYQVLGGLCAGDSGTGTVTKP